MRVLTRNESVVFLLSLLTVCLFLSRLFALTKQLRPVLYLPVAATTSNRVRTKILELIGVKSQISSMYNFKNLRNYLHISKKSSIFASNLDSVLFPVWSYRLWPYIQMSYNIPLRPATASPRNRLNPATASTPNRGFIRPNSIQKRVISA